MGIQSHTTSRVNVATAVQSEDSSQNGFPGGRRLVTGRIINGGVRQPPTVVSDRDVGIAWRVTSRGELMDYIEGGYGA